MSLGAGSRLGPYEILSPLGAGGMGEVYRAKDARLGREVAIKVLPAEVAADASRLKRFEKEARAASALNHPNIVTIYEIGSTDSTAWIAMEKVDGKTLRELLFSGPLPVKRLLQVAAQIGDGLARAHEAGIVHRDLKPENLMVTKDGLVKILDFGLAKQTAVGSGSDEGSHMPTETGTSPGVVLGTVGYMSPEQAAGQPVDFRSDQFAFGSILYELATGKRAFLKKTGVDTLGAILNEDPTPIGSINSQVPAPLRWIVERCLAKDPESRYTSTKDLAKDVASLRDHLSQASSGESPASAPRARAARWKALGAAAVLAAISLVTGKWLWKTPAAPQPSFQRLTFRSGFVNGARFSSDGHSIVYSARWDGEPPHIFLTRPEAPESQRLILPDANLAALSSRGELAMIAAKIHQDQGFYLASGTLETAPLGGGTPREIAEDMRWADWSPDGKLMLVVRGSGALEFPVGKVLHRGEWTNIARFSPAGDRIAYNGGYSLRVMDLSGHKLEAVRRAVSPWRIRGFAWSPSGEELWFSTFEEGDQTLRAVSLAGKLRVLLRLPREVVVEDISREGKVLASLHDRRHEIWFGGEGESRERNLTIFGGSEAVAFSADGSTLLENERGAYYLRQTDGSPAKKLGDGFAATLSPDGKWAGVVRPGPPDQVVLVPTGAGAERPLERGQIEEVSWVHWSLDGRRLLLLANEKGRSPRILIQDVEAGAPLPVTPEGARLGDPFVASPSQDGRFVLIRDGKEFWIYSTGGGDRRRVEGFLPTDQVSNDWTADGRFAFAWNQREIPYRVFRVELSTGRRELWKTITPQDPTGIFHHDLLLAPDGKSYAYNCTRDQADLFLVEGLK